MGNYNGTLAAVRSLGRAGIAVTTADPNRFAVSSWSKYTRTRERSPSMRNTAAFLDWLREFGRTRPKHVLLPTNDDSAWLYALHRDELSQVFYLASPPVDVIYNILNKRRLYEEAAAAGLQVPRTWFPANPDDIAQCCREARFPVIIKPQTQVMFKTQSKGAYIESPAALLPRYLEFSQQTYSDALLSIDPNAGHPMVQEFLADAASGIYNISAYVRNGALCGVRASRKLLQQPRRLGIGVLFEEAPIIPELAAGLERLAARVGFSGVFEAEFIQTGDTSLLIDFNPRFYNQMAFDIARGLPLPLLSYLDALGDQERFATLCESVSHDETPGNRVFVDLFAFRMLMFVQRLSGVLTVDEREQWRQWYLAHRDHCTYAVIDRTDAVPAGLAMMHHLVRYGRHPRNFLRTMVFNRS